MCIPNNDPIIIKTQYEGKLCMEGTKSLFPCRTICVVNIHKECKGWDAESILCLRRERKTVGKKWPLQRKKFCNYLKAKAKEIIHNLFTAMLVSLL